MGAFDLNIRDRLVRLVRPCHGSCGVLAVFRTPEVQAHLGVYHGYVAMCVVHRLSYSSLR